MSDVTRYAHPHTFPNGNVHRHVHPHADDHPDAVSEAHEPDDCFYCVDCEPHRAQSAVVKEATR